MPSVSMTLIGASKITHCGVQRITLAQNAAKEKGVACRGHLGLRREVQLSMTLKACGADVVKMSEVGVIQRGDGPRPAARRSHTARAGHPSQEASRFLVLPHAGYIPMIHTDMAQSYI